jgi:flagellar hook-length control protein FliK
MSDISAYHTQTAKSPASGAAQSASALKSGTGLFSGGAGVAFWDLIFGQLTAPANGQTSLLATKTNAVTAPSTSNGTLEEEIDLALAIDESLLALLGGESEGNEEDPTSSLLGILSAAIDEQKTAQGLSSASSGQQVDAEQRLSIYQQLLDKLTAGTPLENQDQGALAALLTRLQEQADFLRTGMLNGEEAPLQLFIAMGMTPAQLTRIGEQIAKLEEKLDRDITIEDIIAGVGNVIDTIKADERIVVPTRNTPVIAADANAAGSNASQASTSMADRGRYQRAGDMVGTYDATASAQAGAQSAPAATPAKIAAQPTIAPTLAVSATGGDVALAQDWVHIFVENTTAGGFDIHTGLPISHTAQAAHGITGSIQAGQTHPATQMLMGHLSKMGRQGADSEMTIQMDPPELGRVLAKLQFGKDKTVKAVLTVEKPETYAMLIRDAASLERALQDAGLTTDSASLSFELAQDGSAFNSDNNGNGGGEPHGRNGTDIASDEQEIMQTTMTWQVDSETGYVRYSLLA